MSDIEPVVPHTPGTWRLIYFDAPTRGEQIRIVWSHRPLHHVELPEVLEEIRMVRHRLLRE